MSTEEQRSEWRHLARFVSQLGLAPGEELPVEQVEELANAVMSLLDELERLDRDRTEARAWARGFEHGAFTVDTDHLPAWLTAPLEAEDA